MVLRKFLFSILLLTGIIGNLGQAVASGSNQFLLNKGQVHFTDGSKAEKVLCTFGFPSGYAHFLKEGIDYYFVRIDENDSLKRIVERISLRYQHISEQARFEAGERSGYEEHYYQGGRTETAVHTEGVNDFWIRDIYSGIDLHYYLKDGALKYDFIVAAGARIDQIKWKYDGKIRSGIENDAIHIQGQWGKISESKPFSFLLPEKKEVEINYEGDDVFSFGSQNKTYEQELVIDPAIIWATFYGGNDHDAPHSLNYHTDGGFYLTGLTRSTNNIAYNGYINTYSGNWCMFIAKFDSLDTRQWGSYYYGVGTAGGGFGYYEPSGSIYIGFSTRDTGLATRGTKQPIQFDSDILLIKVNLNGYPIWSKYFGGDSSDGWSHLHSNGPKELVLFGSTYSTTSDVNSFGAQSTFYTNPFISKVDSSGNLIWSRLITGNERSYTNDIRVLPSGKIIALAYTIADNLATSGAYRSTRTNNGSSLSDGIIMMLNADGTMDWTTYCGSNAKDVGLNVEIGGSGEIYLTYSSEGNGAEYPPNSSSYAGGQYGDIVLSKWDTSGRPIWSKYYGSTQGEGIADMKLISNNRLVLVGSGMPPGFITNGVFQDTVHWINDGLFLVMDTSGQILWGSYYGLSQNEAARWVDYKDNNFIVAGETTGSPFFQNKSNHQPSYGGGYQDVYIMHILENRLKLDLDLNASYCPGSSMKVAFSILDSVGSNNSVIIQIGNQNGTTFSLLGNKFSNQVGRDSVLITIPTSLGAGEYPLRYILNSPPDTIYPDKKIKISASPNAGFTSSFQPYYCEQDTVVLASNNPSNYSFAWYRDGVPLNTLTDSLLVDTSGTYKVIVTGTNGCKRVSSNQVIRFEYPRAALNWNLDSQQCNNAVSINVRDNSDTNYTYSREWSWNGVAEDTAMNYIRSSADTGMSELRLRIETPNGCVDSIGIHFTVFPKPVLQWTISDTSFCLNDQSLSIQRNEDTTWQLAEINLGDSTVTNAISTVHNYSAAGVYNVKYSVIDEHTCTDTISRSITIYSVPQAQFTTSDSLLCDKRSPFQFVDQSLGANQFYWDLGDSTTSQVQSPTKAYQPGTYLVTLVAFNGNNCSDTFAQALTVHQTESAQITPSSAWFCLGDSIQVQANCTNARGLIWLVQGQAYDTTCRIWVKDSVERTLIRIGSNYCQDTVKVSYSLFPEIPIPLIQRSGDTLRCLGTYSSYQWYKDGQLLNSANGPEYVLTQNGSFYLVVSDSNGCEALSSQMSIQNVGFERLEEVVIRVYPNPASKSLDMDWETSVEEIQELQIYTALGQVVYQAVEPRDKHLHVDVTHWKNGIYTLSLVTDSGNVYSRLIVIQH